MAVTPIVLLLQMPSLGLWSRFGWSRPDRETSWDPFVDFSTLIVVFSIYERSGQWLRTRRDAADEVSSSPKFSFEKVFDGAEVFLVSSLQVSHRILLCAGMPWLLHPNHLLFVPKFMLLSFKYGQGWLVVVLGCRTHISIPSAYSHIAGCVVSSFSFNQ